MSQHIGTFGAISKDNSIRTFRCKFSSDLFCNSIIGSATVQRIVHFDESFMYRARLHCIPRIGIGTGQ